MPIRSNWTLELLLEKTAALTEVAEVETAVKTVLAYMASAPKSRFRGGKALLAHLEDALSASRETDEPAVTTMLEDALAYANEQAFDDDILDRYQLRGTEPRLGYLTDHARRIMTAASQHWIGVASSILEAEPGASGSALLDRLRAYGNDLEYMDAPSDRPNRYRVMRGRAEAAAWIKQVLADRIDLEDLDVASRRIVMSPEALALLAADENGQIVLRAAEMRRRQKGLHHLREVVDDPASTEHAIHEALRHELWIFGGRFVGEASHRRFVSGDEVDIPLLRPDGSLCVVELKRAMLPIIKPHRNGWIIRSAVDAAIGQAINYLRGLDENRDDILKRHGVDTRRANAMVLIGHSAAHPDVDPKLIAEVLRTHNAHLSRIEVLTYDELLDAAQRALDVPG